MRALENPSYDSWRLQCDPRYDMPLRICKCGEECDQDAFVVIRYRDLRMEMSRNEFKKFAETISKANKALQT